MKSVYILLVSFFLVPVLFAQDVNVSVDKQRIFIGEHIHLYLQANFESNQSRGWFEIDTIPHFEILDKTALDSQATSGGMVMKQTVTLTSWDTGKWFIPPYRFAGGVTKAIPITVSFSPMDTSQPYHDIKDIMSIKVPPDSSNWWWYLIGLVLLVALYYILFSGKNEKVADVKPVPSLDIYKNAMNRLAKLDVRSEPKPFYTELVDIFRNYLHQRKNIQSFSKTTDDLAVQVASLSLPAEQYRQLVEILRLSDAVKYAKYKPSVNENDQAVEVVKKNIVTIEQMK